MASSTDKYTAIIVHKLAFPELLDETTSSSSPSSKIDLQQKATQPQTTDLPEQAESTKLEGSSQLTTESHVEPVPLTALKITESPTKKQKTLESQDDI